MSDKDEKWYDKASKTISESANLSSSRLGISNENTSAIIDSLEKKYQPIKVGDRVFIYPESSVQLTSENGMNAFKVHKLTARIVSDSEALKPEIPGKDRQFLVIIKNPHPTQHYENTVVGVTGTEALTTLVKNLEKMESSKKDIQNKISADGLQDSIQEYDKELTSKKFAIPSAYSRRPNSAPPANVRTKEPTPMMLAIQKAWMDSRQNGISEDDEPTYVALNTSPEPARSRSKTVADNKDVMQQAREAVLQRKRSKSLDSEEQKLEKLQKDAELRELIDKFANMNDEIKVDGNTQGTEIGGLQADPTISDPETAGKAEDAGITQP